MTVANNSISLLAMIDPFGGLNSCWPYIGKRWHKDGYGYPKRNQKAMLAHRWSYEHHYNIALTPKIIIRHTCDNRSCCNPLHLLPGTQTDNIKDMHDRNRAKLGQHPWKLTNEQQEKILRLKSQGLSRVNVAAEMGCCTYTVTKYLKIHNSLYRNKYLKIDDSLI